MIHFKERQHGGCLKLAVLIESGAVLENLLSDNLQGQIKLVLTPLYQLSLKYALYIFTA
jgi:hypothetical protein